jgi:glycosyltransferase involved in cell wall biosynthesis
MRTSGKLFRALRTEISASLVSARQLALRVGRWSAQALWRQLPPRFRQKTFHIAVARLRPTLSEVPADLALDPSIPRIVVGFLSNQSGLGQSARLAAEALQRAGLSVYGVDLSAFFYEGVGKIAHTLPDGRAKRGPGHVILVVNAPYAPYALQILGRRFVEGKYVTGYWAWELPRLPQNWGDGFSVVHDLAAPSTFTASAIRRFGGDMPVRVALHPVTLDYPSLESARPHSGPFSILTAFNIGSGFVRKNPCALIQAFKRAFGNSSSVQLKIIATNAEHYPPAKSEIRAAIGTANNISVEWKAVNRGEYLGWWRAADAYVSLHRSEGFGLPLAEALCAGLPTVGTGWSGNMDFMTESNSYPVKFSLVDVCDEQQKYPNNLGQWADPNVDHAAAILDYLATHRTEAAQKALAGAAGVRAKLAGSAFVDALMGRSRWSLPTSRRLSA